MASSSGSLRFADKVSLEEFPKGRENENTRKTTEHNIALLKKFLMPKDESRVFTRNSPDEFIIHQLQRMRGQRIKIIRPVHCIVLPGLKGIVFVEKNHGYSIIKDFEFEKSGMAC